MRPAGTEGWSEEKLADAGHARLHDRHRPAETSERGRMMDGIHDMGGMHGFGKVEPEPNEPVFHAPWEGRTPRAQPRHGLYRHLDHRPDALRHREAAAGRLSGAAPITANGRCGWKTSSSSSDSPAPMRSKPAMRCARASHSNASYGRRRAEHADARLVRPAGQAPPASGRRSRAHQEHPSGRHTPGCRATRATKSASIEAIRGCHVFPDTAALGKGDDPQWLYTVRVRRPRIVG